MQEKVKSEHLFVFPFSWKDQSKKGDVLFHQHTQIQHKKFETLGHWKTHISTVESDKDYNEYVYFYRPIRMALYTVQSQSFIVRNYEYGHLTPESYFEIEIKGKTYHLGIKQIDLKLYKTGIGLLCFRMVNTEYEEVESIKAINSFSTCIYPPVLPIEKAKEMGMPTRIHFYINEKIDFIDDFKRRDYKEYLIISPLIMQVLGWPFTGEPHKFARYPFLVEPILGSQMFCSCMYYNQQLVEKLYRGDEEIGIVSKLMTVNKHSHALAELDKLEGKEESQYLKCEEHIYGINRYMLLCITKEEIHDRLYDQLVKLALMQRATLLNLSAELARISTLPKSELPSAISSIYEIYIQFINQLYFKEVTEDSEGTYIYEQLSRAFKIAEELEQLNFEIDEVHEYANLVEQSTSNIKVQLLTIIGAALVIPSFVTGFFGMNIFQQEARHWWDNMAVGLWLNSYVLLPILAVIALCLWTRKRSIIVRIFKVIFSILLLISLSFILKYGCGL
ncbi:MAG: hypothetical protein E7231_03860 [Cellulosilyticum sp.]|nr:hypothetical protein [Cellulosilyticum sp.]